jgi:hypothetical protein
MACKAKIFIGLGVLLALAAGPAKADSIFEVENARAKARSGYPLSAQDAELLNRWGDLSGSRRYDYYEVWPDEVYGLPPRQPKRHYRRYRD